MHTAARAISKAVLSSRPDSKMPPGNKIAIFELPSPR